LVYRILIVAGFVLAGTGCARDPSVLSGLAPRVGTAEAAPSPSQLPKKTMADRVLAAIALERVTGLKPDPARLLASN
jgi:hypothetical protein